jgi:uncharacterized alkaline shock family protein YloU
MATKTDKKANSNLPLTTDDLTPSSNITYNNEVVAIIAGLAANEVEGIAGMCTVGGSLKSKNRTVTKGVKVEVGTEEVAVDLYVIVEYGIPIQRAAADAQENVRKAIESMTGLHVVRVDVHVQSVSFEQEKKALQAGVQNAALVAGEMEQEKKPEKQPETKKKTEPAKQTEPAKTDEPVKASEPVKVSEPVKKNESGKKAEPAKATKEKPASKSKTEKTEADSAPKTRKTVKKSEDKKEETKGTSEA